VAKSENIQLSQEEISRELNATLSNLQNTKDFQKLNRKSNSQQLMNAMAVQAASRAMNRRVLDLIKSIASGEYQKKEKPENISAKKKTAKKTASKSDKTKEKSVDSIKESKTAKSSPKSSNKKSGDK
jgi:FKBP-type peptidyl-prolyl cis-trans isomerase (trigger factor)